MPKSPSRSEIELALSGRKKKIRQKSQASQPSELDFNESPRRQKVIGGNLSGVNTRNRFSLLSRYSEANIANWIAVVVVLLIIAAFFWPTKKNSITEVSKQLDENKVIAIEDQELEQTAAGNAGFARETDKIRAEKYRAQDQIDKQVKSLLDQASDYIRAKKYTQPRDANAVLLYKKVLTLRPNNIEARENLSKIRGHFLFRGVSALNTDKPVLAKNNLTRLALVDKASSEYADLESDIKEYEIDQQLIALNQKAVRAFENGELVLPVRENALWYFQEALKLRSTNATATQGIQKIADTFAEQANDSILNSDFSSALAQLKTLGLIEPDHQSIPLLQAMIANAKPLTEVTQQNLQLPMQQKVDVSNELQSQPNLNQEPLANNSLATTPTGTLPLNNSKTSSKQANEQALFDKQYLQQGLDAYYSEDYDKAASLLQSLADKGIARAQIRLAYMYFLGRGFPRSRIEANKIAREALPAIRKFANEGRSWAQSDLGSLYEDGLVLSRNYGEAVYWYRTAAEKGYPSAQTNLGTMYARGRGVASNRRTAIEWFQRASKQGDKVARRRLEAMGISN